jgi:myo-inositol catabolism protein IolS
MISLETMRLGHSGPIISRLGMGCWAIGGHGWGKVKDKDSIRAIRFALENGVTFFDTADTYGFGKSETLLAEALDSSRNDVVIASKGGVRWNEHGKVWSDITPDYLRLAVENSLRRLKLDCIPLYYIHKPDDVTPVQESVVALAHLREEGKIGAIGVANFNADQLLQALQAAPISAAQVRFNIFDRDATKDLSSICREHNVTLVAWGALADGLLTGKFKTAATFPDDDHRSKMAEFDGNNVLRYVKCVELLEQLAASTGHKISHLALRWILDFAPFTCSLFGAKTDIQVKENLGADGWNLAKAELITIDSIMGEFGK